jgi:4-hydroxymandelate oxidase
MVESLADYEALAEAALPTDIYDFVAGGSGSELTLRRNRAAFDAVTLIPRVLAGISEPDISCSLLGSRWKLPVAVAPMAYQRLLHPEGELLLAQAAAAAGIPYVISTLSSVPLEKIAAVAPSWFQIYWLKDGVIGLMERAVAAGCGAVVVTVDVPIMGRRLRDLRNSFTLPPDVGPENLVDKVTEVRAHTATAFEPAVTWHDLEWLRERCPIPLVVKGILDPRDARRAVEAGADGVVVSNHGGRQLDGGVASIDALSPVVDAVGKDCAVFLDSGVRSGLDVLKAVALGASGVLVGRPLLWALAVEAVDEALELLKQELRDAMLLAGCADLAAARELSHGRS